jgi:hypothetical protein
LSLLCVEPDRFIRVFQELGQHRCRFTSRRPQVNDCPGNLNADLVPWVSGECQEVREGSPGDHAHIAQLPGRLGADEVIVGAELLGESINVAWALR